MIRSTLPISLALWLALGACAHGAPTPVAPPVERVWPEPPAAPRVRWVQAWSAANVQTGRSGFRRMIDTVIGFEGARDDEGPSLRRPFGVAESPTGAIAIADPDAPGVFLVAADGSHSRVECKGREWASPMAVAYAFGGSLVVADGGAAAVVLVDGRGRCQELGAGEFERPTGLAATGGAVYVVDPPRHTVIALGAGGEVVRRFASWGSDDGQLNFPCAVTVGADGALLVVDALNFRIARFSADGGWLGSFGGPGGTDGLLSRPKGVATAADGRIFVTDDERDAVLVYGSDGTFQFAIGSPGDAPGSFQGPAGLAITGNRLIVADSLNGRVQVFQLLGGST